MKLAPLFVLASLSMVAPLCLFVSVALVPAAAFAQSRPDPLAHILDGIADDARREEQSAQAKAREQALRAQAYRADQERLQHEREADAAAALAVRTSAATSSSAKPKCPTAPPPQFFTRPDQEDGLEFGDAGFITSFVRNADGSAVRTLARIQSVDFRSIAPHATHEMDLTAMIQLGSGWSAQQVNETLAKTASIYAQCGIRIGHARVVTSRYPYATDEIKKATESEIAKSTPRSMPKPWVYFMKTRADHVNVDSGGTSFAFTAKDYGNNPQANTAWIGHDSIEAKDSLYARRPEIVVGHELAHILTNGDHQDGSPNILNGAGGINDTISPHECEQMKSSPLVHAL